MLRLLSFALALIATLLMAALLNRIFGVTYFYNAILVAAVGLGLSDIVYRRLAARYDKSTD